MCKYLVKLTSKTITNEWWGQQWCQNISRYADYTNRLERGRTYIRKGAVQEIEIDEGHIKALVSGTLPMPYSVDIHIKPASEELADKVLKKLNDIKLLREGIVADNYRTLFTVDEGLFPSSREIDFSCSCPDVASLCKHIIAVLYAIGSILDQEPILLFQLRGIDVEKYLDKQLFDITNDLLVDINNHENEDRIIDDSLISNLFGIEMASEDSGNDYRELLKENKLKNDEGEVRIVELSHKAKPRKRPVPKPKEKKNPIEGYVIRQYDKEGKYIRQYFSYEEAENATDIGMLNIKRAISGKKKSAGGYQWKKELKDSSINCIEPLVIAFSNGVAKPVGAYTFNGNLVAEYPSVTEAERETGINSKSIRDTINGIQRHAGGFVWKYL